MSDESKINDAFNMNTDEFVTKQQMTEYTQYLVTELAATKELLAKTIKEGKSDPTEITKMANYYDELRSTNSKVEKYLNYLATQLSSVVKENTSLKETTAQLIKHNDYIAENLENNIKYSTYIAENLDNNIRYNEYIAEHLEHSIKHSDYLAENIEKTIEFSDYITENLNNTIKHNDYLVENLNNSIQYAQYIAEQVDGNINYSQYIAEHLDDTIAYTDYVAEGLDKSIGYSKMIAEKLNNGSINEGIETKLPMPEDAGIVNIEKEKEVEKDWNDEDEKNDETQTPVTENVIVESVETADVISEDITIVTTIKTDDDNAVATTDVIDSNDTTDTTEVEMTSDVIDEPTTSDVVVNTTEAEPIEDVIVASEPLVISNESLATTDLSKQIDMLISEAKKRKASETTEHHFLRFLTKEQVDAFYTLTSDEQENVVSYINENGNYFSGTDVLTLMNESLAAKVETIENKVVRLMPENIKPIWENLNDASKKGILTQAKIHPNMHNEQMIEHFWMTRNLKKNESVNKELISESKIIENDSLSNAEYDAMLERLNSLK